MTANKPARPRRRHAQLHLPPLSADQALALVHVLERAIAAVYRAHGEAMRDLLDYRIDPPPQRTIHYTDALPDDLPF